MLRPRLDLCVLALTVLAVAHGPSSAQSYPAKPIRIITSEAGGGADIASRLVAQGISGPLGQQVIVDNRRGGVIPGEVVSKAPPDGYTLLLFGGSFWLQPFMQEHASYDPLKDFAPISLVLMSPSVLAIHPAVVANSVNELIALVKAKPGALNYAMGAPGSSTHLAGELFKSMAKLDIVGVPFKGTGPSLNALIAGEVQLSFPNATAVTPHIKSGRLRALGVASAQRSALAPDLPTLAASGLPGFETGTTLGVFAPAKTPAAVIAKLNTEIVRFLSNADVKERFLKAGSEAVSSSPDELAVTVKADMERLGKVIKDGHIRSE